MVTTRNELLQRIRLGADSYIGFNTVKFVGGKIDIPSFEKLVNEIASFANTCGGTLVLGVDHTTKKIVGIPSEHIDNAERIVFKMCNDGLYPPVNHTMSRMELPDSTGASRMILNIHIPQRLLQNHSFSAEILPGASLVHFLELGGRFCKRLLIASLFMKTLMGIFIA